MESVTKIIIVLLSLALSAGTLKAQTAQQKTMQEAFSQSYTLEGQGDYTKSIEVLKKIYQDDSYEINLRLGWLTYMSGLFTESVAFYQKALSLMPYSVEARFGIVLPLSALGNWNQIVNHYNEVLKIDPMNYTANYRLGLIYYGREDYSQAYKFFEKIANMYPFDYDAIHMFAWASLRFKKNREALVLFHKALLIRPNDASALEGMRLSR